MMDKTIELSGFEKEKEYIDKKIAGLIYKNDKLKKLFGEKIFLQVYQIFIRLSDKGDFL